MWAFLPLPATWVYILSHRPTYKSTLRTTTESFFWLEPQFFALRAFLAWAFSCWHIVLHSIVLGYLRKPLECGLSKLRGWFDQPFFTLVIGFRPNNRTRSIRSCLVSEAYRKNLIRHLPVYQRLHTTEVKVRSGRIKGPISVRLVGRSSQALF